MQNLLDSLIVILRSSELEIDVKTRTTELYELLGYPYHPLQTCVVHLLRTAIKEYTVEMVVQTETSDKEDMQSTMVPLPPRLLQLIESASKPTEDEDAVPVCIVYSICSRL